MRAGREAAHLQQVMVAGQLGVHKSMVSQYERGLVRPRRAIIERYATVVGIDLVELLVLAEYVRPTASRVG